MQQEHQRAEYMRKLRTSCNVPQGMADVSKRWEGKVLASVMDGERPVIGRLEMFATHLVVVGDGGLMQFALPFSFMLSIQRKREVQFQSRSFAEPPKIRSILEIKTTTSLVTVVIEGAVGMHFAKAIELQWRYCFGMLTEREAKMFKSFQTSDLVYALSLLPFDVECNFAQKISGSTLAVIDRPVVMRIEDNMMLSIIFRPPSFTEIFDLVAWRMDLDKVELIFGKGDEIRLVCENQIFLFNGTVDAAVTIPNLMAIFLANAATQVYRAEHTSRPVTAPLTHDESLKLLDHYLVVDDNLDGSLSKEEFMVSLGPIIAADIILSDALYNLFNYRNKAIHVAEYLHGARVLLRGDEEDRTQFIFGMFDPHRKNEIDIHQFTAGLRTLQKATNLGLKEGQTIETFADDLFTRMDEDKSGTVSLQEFRETLKKDLGVIDELQTTSMTKKADPNLGPRVMSFGHSHWHEITHIMSGIQLATDFGSKLIFNESSYGTKVAFDTVAGTIVGRDRNAKQSGFRRLTNGGPAVVFNDYAPAAFKQIRSFFGITQEDYLSSLGIQQLKKGLVYGTLSALFEMSSSGRSGSLFYTSHDGRFILKTIPTGEADTLRKILPDYVKHLNENRDTLITRFLGLHALIRGTAKTYFVVMANIFLAQLPVHETFDLKGSTHDRTTPVDKRGYGIALKDNDFDKRRLRVNPALKSALLLQVRRDSEMLSKNNLIDYSFLLGIHSSDGSLHAPPPERCASQMYNAFQRFYGGTPTATKTEVLFFGIIDCLTDYNVKKKGEHIAKSVAYDGSQVSCVPPQDYHDRFVRYLDSILVAVD